MYSNLNFLVGLMTDVLGDAAAGLVVSTSCLSSASTEESTNGDDGDIWLNWLT